MLGPGSAKAQGSMSCENVRRVKELVAGDGKGVMVRCRGAVCRERSGFRWRCRTYVGVCVVVHAVACEVVFSAAIGLVGLGLAFLQTTGSVLGHKSQELVVVSDTCQ